jgi:hypothetical protein
MRNMFHLLLSIDGIADFFFRFIALCKANIINKRDKELAMYAFFARNESCRS